MKNFFPFESVRPVTSYFLTCDLRLATCNLFVLDLCPRYTPRIFTVNLPWCSLMLRLPGNPQQSSTKKGAYSMLENGSGDTPPITAVIEEYGRCLELVPMDPHFHSITVSLFVKDDIITVWTFSRKAGVEDRIQSIRDQLVRLGGLVAVESSHNQVRFPCGHLHARPVKFVCSLAVEKPPDHTLPSGEMAIKDTKTKLTLKVSGQQVEDRWVYEVSATGEAPNVPLRLRAIVAGFVRYGEMEKVGDNSVSFPCGQRHDALLRVLLPYARNVSAVEDMLEASAMRGQLTTGTAGFSPI